MILTASISLVLVYLVFRISSDAGEELGGSVFLMSILAFFMPFDIWMKRFLLSVGEEMNKHLNLGSDFSLVRIDYLIMSEYMVMLGFLFAIPFVILFCIDMYRQEIGIRKVVYFLIPVAVFFISYLILMLTHEHFVKTFAARMLLSM